MSMAERKTMTRAVKNPVKRKMTRAEKKEIAAVIQAAKGDGKPHTAQQTIPYLQMYPDGICRVTEKKYSKSLVFEDINYQLAQADDKTAIFENWCDFLNYFDASVLVQLSFINQGARKEKAQAAIEIPAQDDAFNSIRREYADMLKNQLEKGNNGLEKCKYITFSIEADNLAAAKARLSRIETDVLNNFKVLGVTARPMNGQERLNVLHGIFHPEGEPFRFSWDWLVPSGLSTKDFIAPSSFRFGDGRTFRMGRKLGAVSFLEILAPELNDRMLSDILDLENGIIVNLHIRSIDQSEAIKTIKRKITDLDKMKIEEQKKAVRSGYDMDIIPSDLATFGSEAKNLLQDLQSRNERMFLLTFLVVNMADTKRKLDNDIFATAGFAQKNNCALTRLDYLQEAGFMSSIPLGENLIPIQRGLTTSSTAIFIPFITQELFQRGAALYYGLNALSNNMILCDRKQLKNPNGLILGTPGSGKSFAAKREMTNAFLITDDDIIICDPEAEYFSLVQRLGGQVIRLSPAGKGMDGKPQYVNPMDINLNYSEDDNPLALKSDFILSLCELVIGGKEGLQPVEKTVIDRAVRNVYRPFLADPDPAKMPILGDLYNELLKQPEPEAARIAAALELYVSGSLNVFNHRTNVELSNRLVCFDIKQLGKQLKKLGILTLAGARLLMATAEPHVYEAVTAVFSCADHEFTAKGKAVIAAGWKEIERLYRATLKKKPDSDDENELVLDVPDFSEGQTFENPAAKVTEHATTPPKPHNEASLLSAMERAGNEDTDPDAERRGLGTPATRAAVIEKLVKGGFVERKGKQLFPTKDGTNLVCVLPDSLTSPQLTAAWENNLTQIAKGNADPAAFMQGIEAMAQGLVKTYASVLGEKQELFKTEKTEIGKCPRCKSPVYEGKKNYYCSNKECGFTMWKNDRFFEERKTVFTRSIAAALLKSGKVKVKKLYSPKTGKTYDGTVLLADTGGKYVNYKVTISKDKELE